MAKLALFKVAPNLFDELFEGEKPPPDVLDVAPLMNAVIPQNSFLNSQPDAAAFELAALIDKSDNELTLGCAALA